jgi:pimeloyl-ACP methyl ester carboxylesterase
MEKIRVNDIELAYIRRGKGTPLVLLHGYPLDHHLWDDIVPLLEDTFDLILPDLRGFGESTTVNSTYTMDDYASDIAGLLDHLSIQKAAIAGHSMGGYVALAFARIHPERVSGLGLVSSQVLADPLDRKEGRYKSAADVSEKGIDGVVETMAPKFSADERFQAVARETMQRQQPAAFIGALKPMAERMDSTPCSHPSNSRWSSSMVKRTRSFPSTAHASLKAVPRAHLVELKEAGHMPMMESKRETARL